ncbi:hypothetical protein [Streptomyces sp.]|uniref:hypothetical protein n=1 Tax=Streptomyces sp. TaxID=1931 RepID=UPI002810F7F9|nr:hypothetical protein [Streptomyces sp.]
MKSLAREGDSDTGARGPVRPSAPASAAPDTSEAADTSAVPAVPGGPGTTGAPVPPEVTDGPGTPGAGTPDGTGKAPRSAVPAATAGSCSLVLMTKTLRPATDSEPHTIDLGPRRTA